MNIQAIYRPNGSFTVGACVLVQPQHHMNFKRLARHALSIRNAVINLSLHTALAELHLNMSLKLHLSGGYPFEAAFQKVSFDAGPGREPRIVFSTRTGNTLTLKTDYLQLEAMLKLDTKESCCTECGKPLDKASRLAEVTVCTDCTDNAMRDLNRKLGIAA